MKYFTLPLIAGTIALVFATGCNTTPAADGALIGGGLGAGLGAIIGNQSGHAGEGALLGGAAGAITGAVVGDQYEKVPTRTYRRQPQPTHVSGHYENRLVRSPSGEVYEERVWVPDR